GRPRRTTAREDRALRLVALRDRFSSTREIGDRWIGLTTQQISIRSAYRRIRSFGLKSYRPLLCLPLTPRHRTVRLEWCNEKEKMCSFLVWGAICYGSRSPLVVIPGTLNANRFVDYVLEPVLIPYLQGLVNPIFQQDNARPHIARVAMEFLNNANVDLLPWPSRSPDLSPIEHVWDMVGRKINDLQPPPGSIDILQRRIIEAWDSIPQATIDSLILSMPNRLAECVRNRGGPTHY
ncbi:DDE 3 and/or HTH Tnp Tc3 2 domain containing protein, partial [Asbolus verrucosus]